MKTHVVQVWQADTQHWQDYDRCGDIRAAIGFQSYLIEQQRKSHGDLAVTLVRVRRIEKASKARRKPIRKKVNRGQPLPEAPHQQPVSPAAPPPLAAWCDNEVDVELVGGPVDGLIVTCRRLVPEISIPLLDVFDAATEESPGKLAEPRTAVYRRYTGRRFVYAPPKS